MNTEVTNQSPESLGRFEIAGGDDGAYGPRFGPIRGTCVGVFGHDQNRCLVLQLESEVVHERFATTQVALRPRYTGTSFDTLLTEGGTVGVSLVLPAGEQSIREGLSAQNSLYWSIGTMRPSGA